METTNKVAVIIPETLANATTIETSVAAPIFGQNVVTFEYKGKSHSLDTALVVGKGTKSLMSLSVFCKLNNVSRAKSPDAFKKLQDEYNDTHKPAFWAWHNSAVDVMRKEMDPHSIGFRVRKDGSVRATAGFIKAAPSETTKELGTVAGRFIANGEAKAEEISKGKAARQANKGKAAPETTPVTETATK
jgi:hypothetical protein